MRVLALVILVFPLLCCGCPALYHYAWFRHVFGSDEDDVDVIPFTGHWSDAAPLSSSRSTACAAIDTNIYVCGGASGTTTLDTVGVYDSQDDSWTPLSSLPVPASGHVCVSAGGLVYAFGGSGISSAYDPASDLWTPAAAPQHTTYAAAIAFDGKIYYFGGTLPSGYTSASTQIYDPLLDSWSEGATMPESRAGPFCQELGGRIYVIGGYHNPEGGPTDSYADTVFEYDPGGDSWVVRATGLPHARAYGCCAVVNNRIVTVGGFDGNYPGLTWVEAYDPLWNLWHSFAKEPTARSFACGAGVGTRIYVFGGKISALSYTALVREFISP